ncbi:amidohydrolase family protein [Reichenbachiella agarivorans]|uniref:Amidohydrolase family protein n=1 Tax=Reichenbachiella agarivorans TaxID=2979464 RepID=A0ABY6CN86_9BACT|nr:amidohydrolase family protein [Reichenbachiella agarivorans]UXP31982.1 amidohydrolase family protein [Reichenbachiella agarivorans]
MRIDSHQHFWKYDPTKHAWIDDSMSVIQDDFFPSDLRDLLQQNRLDGTVAVQADQTEAETEFLLDLALKYDYVKAVVGWVDLQAENVAERLAHYAKNKKFVGVRHVVQEEPDPEFMLGANFQRGLTQLKDHGLTYDILIFPTQMKAALETIERHPEQPFVIDHIAKPYIKEGKIDEWIDYMRKMAAHENVMCKLSGMVTEADWTGWKYEDFVPYLDVVVEAFGVDRLMYGSDWPVCLLGGSYDKVKSLVDRYFEGYSQADQDKIYGDNAVRFYGIK